MTMYAKLSEYITTKRDHVTSIDQSDELTERCGPNLRTDWLLFLET